MIIKKYSIIHTFISIFIIAFFCLATKTYSKSGTEETVAVRNFNQKYYQENQLSFELSSSNSEFEIINTPFQKITNIEIINNTKRIKIITGLRAGKQIKLADPSRYLLNTRFLNISHPEILKLSQTLAQNENKITAVENFVYSHINHKTTGIPLLQANNILKNRSGDCTEHTVLAISLLRSLKIPARALVGMVLVNEYRGAKNVFVFHMWAEAYYNKTWILVDATSPGPKRHERYIAFAEHNLKTEMPLSYLRTISAIQNLSATAYPLAH